MRRGKPILALSELRIKGGPSATDRRRVPTQGAPDRELSAGGEKRGARGGPTMALARGVGDSTNGRPRRAGERQLLKHDGNGLTGSQMFAGIWLLSDGDARSLELHAQTGTFQADQHIPDRTP